MIRAMAASILCSGQLLAREDVVLRVAVADGIGQAPDQHRIAVMPEAVFAHANVDGLYPAALPGHEPDQVAGPRTLDVGQPLANGDRRQGAVCRPYMIFSPKVPHGFRHRASS